MNIKQQKDTLRKRMLTQRNNILQTEKSLMDLQICNSLKEIVVKKNIKKIHTYLPMKSEVNLLPFIEWALKENTTIITSKTLKKRRLENLILSDLTNMEQGIYGTYHPKDAITYNGDYDLIIVAGLAFSTDQYRLGYGGGYYDSFLKNHPYAYKVGVAYPFQVLNTIPIESHDIQLDVVITH